MSAVGRFAFVFLIAAAAHAQSSPAPPLPDRELAVGVFEAPPYSLKSPAGEWRGFSVDLWRQIADDLHVRYRLVEGTEDTILESLANNRLDLVAGPVAVTMARERVLDFTESYMTSGLSVAVRERTRLERFVNLFRSLATSGAAHIMVVIVILSVVFGAAVWRAERRHNPQFPPRPSTGIGSGLWWAGVTTTGVGYGDKVPITLLGRLLAGFWMGLSLVLYVLVTASLAATLAVGEFQQVRDVDSLRRARVGALAGSAAADFLRHNQIKHRIYPSYGKVIEALVHRQVDAVMFNEEILRYYADRAAGAKLHILPPLFLPQDFAFALADGSALRAPIDHSLRKAIASTHYRDLKDQYLYLDELGSGP